MTKIEDFLTKKHFGEDNEDIIGAWLLADPDTVGILPTYEVPETSRKGPRFYAADRSQLIAPDSFVLRKNRLNFWAECKSKSSSTWHWTEPKEWQTGCEEKHLAHYELVQQISQTAAWIYFLHLNPDPTVEDLAHDCEGPPPVGLFKLKVGTKVDHHGTMKDGTKMVYWSEKSLLRLATLDEIWEFKEKLRNDQRPHGSTNRSNAG